MEDGKVPPIDNKNTYSNYFIFINERMYEDGRGVTKDLPRAAQLYTQSAELGSSFAQSQLGYMYFNGIGVERDNEQAIK